MTIAFTAPAWLTTCFGQQTIAHDWLLVTQIAERENFLQRGFPLKSEERWKYTDLSFLSRDSFMLAQTPEKAIDAVVSRLRLQNTPSILAVLLNGKYSLQFSDLSLLPEGVTLCSLANAFLDHADQIKLRLITDSKHHPFASLNAALVADGVYLAVSKNTRVTMPIHLLHINSATQNFVACPRNMVIVESGAQVNILEEHIGLDESNYFINMVTDIDADSNAIVDYHKIQNESPQAAHIAQIFVTQKQDATVNLHTLATGAHLGRDDIAVNLQARGAACQVNGFYYLNADNQQIDNHILVDHKAPYTVSEMLYKGIADKKSKVIFNGKILVHKDAQKTQSHQYNHNLTLSTAAEINTKPELEIYADDVKCAHGSTVGQLDETALFYLRSRGIAKAQAMKILTKSFAADVLSKITCGSIKQKMSDLITEKFAHDE